MDSMEPEQQSESPSKPGIRVPGLDDEPQQQPELAAVNSSEQPQSTTCLSERAKRPWSGIVDVKIRVDRLLGLRLVRRSQCVCGGF
jgi:hypothetical protein